MGNKKLSHKGLWLVMAILAVISYFVFVGAFKDGITLTNDSNNGVSNIESIEELKNSVLFKLDIPEYVTNSEEELTIEVVAGQVATVYSTKFVMKASLFVNINADILGLYEDSKVEEDFIVKNSNITYFKYRQGYVEYPNCTIINWCTHETSYGLMIEEDLTLEESLNLLGLSAESLVEDVDEPLVEEDISEEDNTYTEYTIEDKYSIKLPQFKGEVTHIDMDSVSAFFAGDSLLFLVVYNEEYIRDGVYEEQSVIDISDNLKIYYNSSNTCDYSKDAYEDYELLLSTIDDIAKTIVSK